MAGGNFLGRVLSYVVNEIVVEGLANNQAFQRVSVRTNKAINEMSIKAAQAKEGILEQVKEASRNKDYAKEGILEQVKEASRNKDAFKG